MLLNQANESTSRALLAHGRHMAGTWQAQMTGDNEWQTLFFFVGHRSMHPSIHSFVHRSNAHTHMHVYVGTREGVGG